jgi:hypothetical protein
MSGMYLDKVSSKSYVTRPNQAVGILLILFAKLPTCTHTAQVCSISSYLILSRLHHVITFLFGRDFSRRVLKPVKHFVILALLPPRRDVHADQVQS